MKRNRIVGLLAFLAVAGCDWFENPSPQEVRVLIQGDAGAPIRLIISTEFVSAINQAGETRVEIFNADTVFVTLPFDRSYDIEDDNRFFVEAARLEQDLENVRMQVFVDNLRRFDESGILTDGAPYRFLFSFNQAIVRDIEVL